ncbi:DNA-repair protein, UmuC-like protein [Corchorus capsularis]|uniref:DNA polymerase kappa n=1 Tax=Corchorus capsularis TaxID=210143 RepID=A0A1R3HUM3_COCAP|nr:DNA-repair protein, UmuC-like protein [Corchorus capsularis]
MEESESTSDNQRPWQSYHTVYTNAKAGMDGVDKEKVQRVVYEMSKGSKYFENEERKESFIRQKIEHMRARAAKLSAADLSHYQKVVDKRILELEASRELSRIWLHVDMDAFYAAVETLSDPSLKGKPMAVGSMSMISTANYEARKFGVRAAMPGFIARKLCPELIFVPTDFKKYTHYSDLTRKVFQNYDPNFMLASLDEAYLDITEVSKERGITGGEIAEELRSRVHEETGLTCSAGVAPNRLLAKVCSDINKPNGQFVLPNDCIAVMTFISSLPIRKIGGIGKVTENILRGVFGINTCEEMLQKGSFLCALFSPSTADFFLSVGLGLGGTDKPEARFRKSISSERTFSATQDATLLYQKLADIAEMLSADMQKEGLLGRTLTLKLKTASFEITNVEVGTTKCPKEEVLWVPQEDSSVQREPEDRNLDSNKEASTSRNEEFFSSNQMELLYWVDDYKCSLCGAELPSSFVEERQEHSDFHLAERLQKEESGADSRAMMPRQRIYPKDPLASQKLSRICYPRIPSVPVSQLSVSPLQSSSNRIPPKAHLNSLQKGTKTKPYNETTSKDMEEAISTIPSMSDILASSRAQNLDLQLQTVGPFFRITAKSLESNRELGRAEGLIRVWFGGKILHLDSIRLKRDTLSMERSIFGIGLFIGAVAIRYGYDCGCRTAELLAINDSDLYHSKLVRFYQRIGFKTVYEVTGSTIGDMAHMLMWGGIGTRMDASIEELLVKWCRRFKSQD